MTNQPSEQFNLEQMFLKYLNLVGLRVHDIHPDHLREIKRAFYGAAGQCIVLFMQEIPDMSELEAIHTMDGMMVQIKNFWDQQNKQQNG